MESGEIPAAKATFRKAIELKPGLADAYFLLASALLEENAGSREAATALEKAIALAPRFPDPYFLLGKIRDGQGQYAETAELLEKAVTLDPRLKKAHYRLAQTYRRLGEIEKAKKHLAIFRELEVEEKEKVRETVEKYSINKPSR